MNRKTIRDALADQREERDALLHRERLIDRDHMEHWRGLVDSAPVKVITGIRRSGKTVFTHLLLQGMEHAAVNFDDERLAYLDKEDMNDLLEALYEVYGDFTSLVLDEVQNIGGWELFVNRLHRSGKNIFVTGSNSLLLSRELSTHLTGRHLKIELYPFSFTEFLRWHGVSADGTTTKGRGLLKGRMEEYMSHGGFPEVVRSPGMAGRYLADLYSSILTRDVVSRHGIRYVKTFREMSSVAMAGFSSMMSFNRMRKAHGLKSVHTVKNYFGYLEESYLIHLLEKYSPKPREVMNSPKKLYVADHGLARVLTPSVSENLGRTMENVVVMELLRRKALEPALELYYWRDYQDREIDVVLKTGRMITALVQVTYASGPAEIVDREVRSLLKGSQVLGCDDLRMVTWDYEDEVNEGGKMIRCVPIWKMLLEGVDESG
jgi:predicted AAA+ superfamily ATPase